MNNIILVFLGAGIGGVMRFLFGRLNTDFIGLPSYFATFGVNMFGGLIIGIAADILTKQIHNQQFIQYFIMIGVLGGFTTFSSFSLDVVRMIEQQRFFEAFAYIFASVSISIIAVFVGMVISRHIV